MSQNFFLKSIALLNFIFLMTAFLLYRNGSFNDYFFSSNEINLSSPNGGTPTKITKDSTAKIIDSLQIQRFPSSKSIILIDPLKQKKDTTVLKKDSIKTIFIEEKSLLYSSKSGMIVDPKKTLPDTLKNNKRKKKKKQK